MRFSYRNLSSCRKSMTRYLMLICLLFESNCPLLFQNIKNVNSTSGKGNCLEMTISPWMVGPRKDHRFLDFNGFQQYLRHFKVTLKLVVINTIYKLISCLSVPNDFIKAILTYLFIHYFISKKNPWANTLPYGYQALL